MRPLSLTSLLLALLLALMPRPAVAQGAGSGGDATIRVGTPAAKDTAGPCDWLIAGGAVVDGTGAPARRADVLVRNGRIAFVGSTDPDTLTCRQRFDATGLVVTPGFIDAHAHGDPVGDPSFANFLAMGVTTIVLGQDGDGPAVAEMVEHLDAVDAARPGVNVAYLVGHNTIRVESGVGYGDPGPEGLERMRELVARGLAAGAFGLSTGLEYDPGSRAGADELAAIAGPVAAAGGVVTSHMRSEDADRVEESLEELIEQGRRSGARVHAAHLKIVLGHDPGQAAALLRAMEEARAAGVGVTADLYPYTASYTGLSILFPEWARPPNDYATVAGERRDELAGYLRRRVEGRNGPDATLFGSGAWAGRTLAEVAAERGIAFEDLLLELGPEGTSAAYFVMDEAVVRALLRDPHVVVSSDGSPTMLHPRAYGSFARVIRRYVVEEGTLTLEEAVRKMSGATAAIYRLDDAAIVDRARGLVREGWAADLVAFDPAAVRDLADFEHPHRRAEGMRAVWVNGEPAWRDGEPAPGPGRGAMLRARW
ncbi:MAG: amidohydrolase family protein [Gemmatimonadota bacterium]